MKRVLKIIVTIVLILGVSLSLISCNKLPENYHNVIGDYEYNESVFAAAIASVKPDNVCLANEGVLLFNKIVYPSFIADIEKDENGNAVPADMQKAYLVYAVKFMASTLESMIGDKPEPVASDSYSGGAAIRVILNENIADETQKQGYKLIIASDGISIISDELQGLTNGIYSFLEDKLGCMFVSTLSDYIPSLATINLGAEEYVDTPDISWRRVNSSEAKDWYTLPPWSSKLRLNGATDFGWYRWSHSSFDLLSPEEYFDEHPEYFSYVGGKRTYKQGPVSGQLCWTNEDVYDIISEKVLSEMAENPDIYIWDVSQMDTWINRGVGCRCDNCKAIDDAEGTQMGSLLTFINRLADEVADKFPNNFISTLAYNYTAKVPETLRPRDNVIIKLCLMPGDSSSEIANAESGPQKDSNEIISDWGKIAKHILIWDYNVNYKNYLLPHPALNYIAENHRFYIDNNVYGIFHQMAGTNGGVDAELTSYLMAKSMWDSDIDLSALAAKYLTVYYGKAAPQMVEYYNDLNRSAVNSPYPMYIYDMTDIAAIKYLPSHKIKDYFKLFDEAFIAADGDEILISRIRKAKIGILYTKATAFSLDISGRKAALNELNEICTANGIKYVKEDKDNSLESYYNKTMSMIYAAPWILLGIILVTVSLILGITILVLRIKKKKRNKALSPPEYVI